MGIVDRPTTAGTPYAILSLIISHLQACFMTFRIHFDFRLQSMPCRECLSCYAEIANQQNNFSARFHCAGNVSSVSPLSSPAITSKTIGLCRDTTSRRLDQSSSVNELIQVATYPVCDGVLHVFLSWKRVALEAIKTCLPDTITSPSALLTDSFTIAQTCTSESLSIFEHYRSSFIQNEGL